MIADKNKRVLENALGKLLGFEEGEAEDLLEHLFTIEFEDDLSEYLVQLLGGQTPEVVNFVENVSRHRRGESLNSNDDNGKESSSKQAAVAVSSGEETSALDSFRAMALQNNTVQASKKNEGRKNTNRKQGNKSRVPPPKKMINGKKTPPPSATTASAETAGSSNSTHNETQNQSKPQSFTTQEESKEAEVVEKFHPSRGKAKIICGCFGTKHEVLTNCLYCGRIICKAEGYCFCPFCGFMVEGGTVGGNEKAYQQKERLLRFDRDFARRTEVFDDQADYQGPTTWMTQEEQEEAEENQQKNLESLKRPKQTFNLDI
mmetsp:Transcript_3266/g.7053  ORF Transcript_3266/g.7053 Transcript_3266/m.7053 type:complete len:317 (-) Transcript_3266:283-1233(-)|eukprot:CAMPEP_0168170716 /NCGR_PEP_ID=MMETSP0139_2-20121125/4332_1 /TAXON_ID=44445 /ORGANISM="Pseudo-nitzschia australis, Strain 10249 10 AB" /LENGTH=316 /DNA_ID=CAMNT_0008088245 /DNA_START=178 /DNA_END=1128 /DNA_ORIENTATION=-